LSTSNTNLFSEELSAEENKKRRMISISKEVIEGFFNLSIPFNSLDVVRE